MKTGKDGLQLSFHRFHVLELGNFMSADSYSGLFTLNKGPSNVVVAFGNNIPHLILMGISFSLEDGELSCNHFLWT